MQVLWYSLGITLTVLCISRSILSGGRGSLLQGCWQGAQHAAVLEKSLLVGIQQLRYEQKVLQAERDKLLGTRFHKAPPKNLEVTHPHYIYTISNPISTMAPPSANASLPQLFMFIAVFSTTGFRQRRDAVRLAYMNAANRHPEIEAKFVLTGAERNGAIDIEASQFGDMLFTDDKLSGYRSIVHKTYFVLAHVANRYEVSFIMKADDDAFVNVPALVEELKIHCTSPGCRHERIYFGREIRNNVVRLAVGDKWRDVEYLNHTSLKTYMPYMMGGGYVLSADLASVILGINQRSHEQHKDLLKFMPNEDVSIGFWLMSVELRRIDHQKVVTWGHPCCFERVRRKAGRPDENRAWFRVTIDLCREDWLILHKIEHVEELRYLGQRLAQCDRVHKLKERARKLAVAFADPQQTPALDHGKVRRLSDGGAQGGQFALGSYSGSAWSASGAAIAALRLPQQGQTPLSPGQRIQIGIFRQDAGGNWKWEQLDTSAAWKERVGPHLQWLGASSRHLVFNDIGCPVPFAAAVAASDAAAAANKTVSGAAALTAADSASRAAQQASAVCGVVYDLQRMSRLRVLPAPVLAVSPDGGRALSLNFQRLEAAVPGSGYWQGKGSPADLHPEATPSHDGLLQIDMFGREVDVLVSLQRLWAAVTKGPMAFTHDKETGLRYYIPKAPPQEAATDCMHWVSDPQYNREGDGVVFLYRIGRCSSSMAAAAGGSIPDWTYLFTVDTDGGNLWRIPTLAGGSHDYGRHGRLLVCDTTGVYEVINRMDITRQDVPHSVSAGGSGSISDCRYFHENERFVAAAAASGGASSGSSRELFVWDRWQNHVHIIGSYAPRTAADGFTHDGLQPLWSPDGRHIAFDSTHGGQGWQVYVAGLSQLGVSMLPTNRQRLGLAASPAGRRHVYVNVGAKRGASITAWLAATPDHAQYEIHAWEPSPVHLPALQAFAARPRLGGRMRVHPVAAWTDSSEVELNMETAVINGDYRGRRRRRNILKRFGSWIRSWRRGQPGRSSGSMFVATRNQAAKALVPCEDFSSWMLHTFSPEDHLVLHMDIAGAEFEVLEKMVIDGAILLVDRLDIKWSDVFRPEYAEWPDLFEQIFAMLGVEQATAVAK